MESAAATRSVPEARPGSVTIASPPWALIDIGDFHLGAGDQTWPTLASTARFQTWTIIGSPLMSARGLPGSLVEAIRAGMTTMVFWCSIMGLRKGAANWSADLYRIAGHSRNN